MELKVAQKQFIEIKGISHLVNHKIDNSSFYIEDQIIKGSIIVSLNYYSTLRNDVIDDKLDVTYQILSNKEKIVNKIEVIKMDFQVIDNQGIDIEFELMLDVISINDQIKNDVLKQLDDNLIDILDERQDVIETIDDVVDKLEEVTKTLDNENLENENNLLDESNNDIEEITEEAITPLNDEREFLEEAIEINNEDILQASSRDTIIESTECKIKTEIKDFNEGEEIMYDMEESYQTIKIIFTNNEADLNRICELYNKTLSEIYEENNYSIDNRIILKLDEF